MTSITPMFQGWHRKLYGRRPLRRGFAMQRKAVDLSTICLRQAKDLFGDLLATGLLEKVPGFRSRSFPLPVVFWTFLCQVLARGFLPTGRVLSAGASEPTWQGHLFAKHRSILQGVGSYSDLFDHQDSPASHLCYVPSSNGLPKTKFPTGHSDENPEPSNDDRSHISCSMFPDIK
jgi:hypothetical protein